MAIVYQGDAGLNAGITQSSSDAKRQPQHTFSGYLSALLLPARCALSPALRLINHANGLNR